MQRLTESLPELGVRHQLHKLVRELRGHGRGAEQDEADGGQVVLARLWGLAAAGACASASATVAGGICEREGGREGHAAPCIGGRLGAGRACGAVRCDAMRCDATKGTWDGDEYRYESSAQRKISETERHARHMRHPILLDIPQHVSKVEFRDDDEGQLWAAPCMHVRACVRSCVRTCVRIRRGRE